MEGVKYNDVGVSKLAMLHRQKHSRRKQRTSVVVFSVAMDATFVSVGRPTVSQQSHGSITMAPFSYSDATTLEISAGKIYQLY